MKFLVEWVLGKKARTGPGVLSFVTNPQMKNPFEVSDNNAFAE